MLNNIKTEKAMKVGVISSEDGPTAIFLKKPKITKKKVIALVAILIALALIAEVITAFILCNSVLSKNGSESFYKYAYGEKGLDISENDTKWVTEKAESLFLENDDGKKLHALEITNKNISHSYAVICHQYGESAASMGEYAKHFYELGFNILLPDLRGHGKNEYSTITMGWEDRLDILKWIDNIIEKDSKARIVLFGVSLGGSAVAMTAGEELPENVRAVIADSCYADFETVMKGYIKDEKKLPSFPILNIASKFSEIKNGWSFDDISTLNQSAKIRIPVLYIHGEEDTFVHIGQSNDIYEACQADIVEQTVIQDGIHAKNLETNESDYWGAVDMFILNNIGL